MSSPTLLRGPDGELALFDPPVLIVPGRLEVSFPQCSEVEQLDDTTTKALPDAEFDDARRTIARLAAPLHDVERAVGCLAGALPADVLRFEVLPAVQDGLLPVSRPLAPQLGGMLLLGFSRLPFCRACGHATLAQVRCSGGCGLVLCAACAAARRRCINCTQRTAALFNLMGGSVAARPTTG